MWKMIWLVFHLFKELWLQEIEVSFNMNTRPKSQQFLCNENLI